MAKGTCSVEDCERPHYARSWCRLHYKRWMAHGTTERIAQPAYPIMDPRHRIISGKPCWVLNEQTGCWEWNAAKSDTGYGNVVVDGLRRNAHRWMYELHNGPIPSGMELDHLCRNPGCVNPAHLEPVTPRENTLRSTGQGALNARKTHCRHGHEYTPENIYWKKNPNGRRPSRMCRTCQMERVYERRRRTTTGAD